MADYYTPTIVEPLIPASDVTPLERLLLEGVFELAEEDGRLYLCHSVAPNGYPEADRETLETALAVSGSAESRVSAQVAAALAAAAADGPVLVELDRAEASPEVILQDIVRRSPTLEYVTVISAFTCSKMRMDGFGGAVTLITRDLILTKSTTDALGELMDGISA